MHTSWIGAFKGQSQPDTSNSSRAASAERLESPAKQLYFRAIANDWDALELSLFCSGFEPAKCLQYHIL
jgi:hypothetical protein